MVCVFAGGKGVWRWAWCCCNASISLARTRARIIYMVFGGNECLACSALHPSYFLPYFSLIGFKVGGVNAEKGVSCGGHKVGWITYAMGEWGICSARLVVW